MKINPFLNGKSEIAKKYFEVSSEMMKIRIKYKMKESQEEDALLEILDELCKKATEQELKEIDELPSRWWFQYIENGQMTNKSELDVYPYAQYFTKQEPLLAQPEKMKGSPYFGGSYQLGDAVLYLMIDVEEAGVFDKNNTPIINRKLVSMSNRHYEQLQKDYDFVQYCSDFPLFKNKNFSY